MMGLGAGFFGSEVLNTLTPFLTSFDEGRSTRASLRRTVFSVRLSVDIVASTFNYHTIEAATCQHLLSSRHGKHALLHGDVRDARSTISCAMYRYFEPSAALLLVYVTRQILFEPSSLKTSEPSLATVTPTGRPHTLASSTTKPVTKSWYSPVAFPSGVEIRTTL